MRPPESWRTARVTAVIAIVTFASWFLLWAAGFAWPAAIWGGFIPARVGGLAGDEALAPVLLTPLTAALLHADLLHLAMNLLILVFCGRAVEGVLGGKAIVILYLVGAYAAAAGHYLLGPNETVPMIGASGAISAVLGAYAMLFGRNKVRTASPALGVALHALWLIAAWIGIQFLIGLATRDMGIAIAVGAHMGGFLVGVLLARPLLLWRYRKA